jgi:hypothetical protein
MATLHERVYNKQIGLKVVSPLFLQGQMVVMTMMLMGEGSI